MMVTINSETKNYSKMLVKAISRWWGFYFHFLLFYISPMFNNEHGLILLLKEEEEIKTGVLQIIYCFYLFTVFLKEMTHPFSLLGSGPCKVSSVYMPNVLTLDLTMWLAIGPLIQYDWCPYKKGTVRHGHRENATEHEDRDWGNAFHS